METIPSRINLSSKEKWKAILLEVEKDEIPVEVLDSLSVNLTDGSVMNINIRNLILTGNDPHAVNEQLDKKLKELDDKIVDIDFHINIDAVADLLQPVTDKILQHL